MARITLIVDSCLAAVNGLIIREISVISGKFRVAAKGRLKKKARGMMRIFFLILCFFWSGALVIRADTHYVSLNGTNNSPYTTWADAATQIQWAVDNAVASDTVLVSNGTYNLTNQINILTNITVRSLNGTNVTIVNGNYPAYTNRCVYMKTGVLDGFTVSNGFYIGSEVGGGGILITNAGSVFNCLIYRNSVSNVPDLAYGGGGGIYIYNGGTVSNCAIVSNTACLGTSYLGYNMGCGGGIFIRTSGSLVASRISGNSAGRTAGGFIITPGGGAGAVVSNCIVDNNSSSMQGGIWMLDGITANCVISNNIAFAGGQQGCGGGSLENDSGTAGLQRPVVKDSVIIGNVATSGICGGIAVGRDGILSNCQVIANVASNIIGGVSVGSPAVVVNCVIARNVCRGFGAGIYIGDTAGLVKNCLIYGNTNLTAGGGGVAFRNYNYATTNRSGGLINCTIAGNVTGTEGGGIFNRFEPATNYIENCVVYGNISTNDDSDDIYNGLAYFTNQFWHTCASTNLAPNQGNITNNPLFVDSANGNYRVAPNSPCINRGTNQTWMTNSFDMDGRTRIRYGTVDMGAYELILGGTVYRFY